MDGHYLKIRPRRKLGQWLASEMSQQDTVFITQHVDIFSDKKYKRRSMVNFSMAVFFETILLLKQKGLESEWTPHMRFALDWSLECLPWISDSTLVSRLDICEPPSIYVIKKEADNFENPDKRFNIRPIRSRQSYVIKLTLQDLGVEERFICKDYPMYAKYNCERYIYDDCKQEDEEFLNNVRVFCS